MSAVYLQSNDAQVRIMEICVPITGQQLMDQLTNIAVSNPKNKSTFIHSFEARFTTK